jgi:DNA-binding NarL/FixJ family response regulator
MTARSVFLVEDHRMIRDGLKALFEREPDLRVMGDAEDGEAAIAFAQTSLPDLILMDLSLPGMNGIDATSEILRRHPEAKIIVLSMYDDESSVVDSIRAGARGYVVKKATAVELLEAMRIVLDGGSYLSPQISDRLLLRIQRGQQSGSAKAGPIENLSPREGQVLRMVAEGKTSKEIATVLGLGLQTVRSYRKTMMKKLGVNNVASLTKLALTSGAAHMEHGLPRQPS